MFNYKWYLKDGFPSNGIKKNNLNVFSCFACGGGSTMGYKLAGYNVLGCNEIDPKMIEVYKENHHPQFLFKEDIRTFKIRKDLPKELYNLDILDGSPPCSSFSMAGNRDKDWGKKKIFREGQAEQTLDDLFFDFLDLAQELKPKVIVAENVKGMLIGNAKGYTKKILKRFSEIGYTVQLFLLNAGTMGVPQKRERVFFIAYRNNLKFPKLEMSFNEKAIPFREILEKDRVENLEPKQLFLWKKRKDKDNSLADICKRVEGKNNYFSHSLIRKCKILPTLTAHSDKQHVLFDCPRHLTDKEGILGSSFPLDYNFLDTKPGYLIGMSVPPVVMAQVSNQINKQWFNPRK